MAGAIWPKLAAVYQTLSDVIRSAWRCGTRKQLARAAPSIPCELVPIDMMTGKALLGAIGTARVAGQDRLLGACLQL